MPPAKATNIARATSPLPILLRLTLSPCSVPVFQPWILSRPAEIGVERESRRCGALKDAA